MVKGATASRSISPAPIRSRRPDQLAGRLCRRRIPDQMDRADPAQSCRYAGARRGNPRQRRRLRNFRRDFSAKRHADHAGMAGGNQRALVRAAALPRFARRRGRAGGRRPHAGRSGNHPLHRILRHRPDGKAFLSREVLGGGSGGRYYADGNDAIHIVPDSRNQPAEFTETRFPLLVKARAANRFRRRRQAPRRPRLRKALPRAGRLPHHRHRRSRPARMLRRQWRQGRHAVLRHRRYRGEPRDLGGLVDGEPVRRVRSCASSPPAAAAGAIRSSANPNSCCAT